MNSRDRLARAYHHQEMDRPGVYSRTGFPPNDPTYDQLKAYLLAHADLKRGWNGRSMESRYSVSRSTEPYSEDFERLITILHTPKGDLRATSRVGLKNQPGLPETFFVNSREDAEKYLSLPLPEVGGDVSAFFDIDRELGDRGITDVGLGFNPAGHVADLCGSENFAILSLTDRDILHALCQRQMTIMQNTLKYLIAQRVGPYFSMLGEEYIVPPLHGPKDFWDFNVRYDKPVCDLIHNAGGRIHIHSHGSMKSVVAGFVEAGADVLHPFEAPPMGDITPKEIKAAVRGKCSLEGNIQIDHMYMQTPAQIRAQTEALIADTFDDHQGLIVSPTASPYAPGLGEECFPMYKAMIDTVVEWKG